MGKNRNAKAPFLVLNDFGFLRDLRASVVKTNLSSFVMHRVFA